MKKFFILFSIILILISSICIYRKKIFTLIGFNNAVNKNIGFNKNLNNRSIEYPFKEGEEMLFDFILYKLTVGKSILKFSGETKFNNKQVFLIESQTNALNYKGEEKIFCETERFYPLRVERKVKIGWSRENIIEDYDVDNNSVVINKNKNGKVIKELRIKKKNKLQNVITLLYYLRAQKDLSVGRKLLIQLPTRSLQLQAERFENLRVPLGEFKALFISDKDRNLSVWLSADGKNLPLQLHYKFGIQSYAMKLRKVTQR